MALNQTQLRNAIKFQLGNFSSSSDPVSDDTVFSEILSNDDGIGTANSKRIFKSFIRWTLIRNGAEDVNWPANWIDLTVSQLAEKLIPTEDD